MGNLNTLTGRSPEPPKHTLDLGRGPDVERKDIVAYYGSRGVEWKQRLLSAVAQGGDIFIPYQVLDDRSLFYTTCLMLADAGVREFCVVRNGDRGVTRKKYTLSSGPNVNATLVGEEPYEYGAARVNAFPHLEFTNPSRIIEETRPTIESSMGS